MEDEERDGPVPDAFCCSISQEVMVEVEGPVPNDEAPAKQVPDGAKHAAA